ncbi:hypothetical protein quinque_014213 [Culex quinquefasciatus]
MTGRGKGGKGLGKGGAKRHRKVLRDNIQGITKPAIRRLARRGGVKRISGLIYEETRGVLKVFLENVIRDAVTYTEHAKRKTVTAMDVGLKQLIDGTDVVVTDHPTLNQVRCVVSCSQAIGMTEEELVNELKDQRVTAVRKFTRLVNGARQETASMVLTIQGTVKPEFVFFGFQRCESRLYIPAPMMCYSCYEYGHSKAKCGNQPVCRHCSTTHELQTNEEGKQVCDRQAFCKNCKGGHSPSAKTCPRFIEESEIAKIRTEQQISFNEARQKVAAKSASSTFANTVNQNFTPIEPRTRVQDTEGMNRLLNLIGGHLISGSRSTLIQVHRATIQAKMFHGVGITSRASEAVKRKVEPTFTAGIRRASGAFRSSPVKAVLVEARQLPFGHVETERLVNTACRIQAKINNNSGELLAFKRARDQLEKLTNEKLPEVERNTRTGGRSWSVTTPKVDWEISAHVRAGDPASKVSAVFGNHIENYKDFWRIYTDGSVSGEIVGCGVVDGINNRAHHLPSQCSIFSAEAYAIMDALKTIGAEGQPAVIFSDSASVLAAFEGGRSRHPWIQVIEAELDRTSAILCWIPGHANIRGNEEADRLAGSAEELEILQTAVPAEDIKRWAKIKLRLSWEMEWLNERDLQLRRVKPTTLPGKDRESQAEQRTLTRLRIGHTRSCWTIY